MFYFSEVQGNVKGGCDVKLGRLTLITGVNGAGKSRIVNTLELAASAEASDIVGRARVKRGLDLLAMAPLNESLEARAKTSDGKDCSLIIERAGPGKGKAPQHVQLSGLRVEYPIRAVLEALRGDVRKAQGFVLQHAGMSVSDAIIKKNIDKELHDLYDTFVLSHEDQAQGIPRLSAIRDDAAKIARVAGSGERKAQTIIDSLASNLPLEEPTDDVVEEATQLVRNANTKYSEALDIPESVDLISLKEEARNAIEIYKKTEHLLAQYKKEAAGIPDPAAKIRLSMIPLLTVYAQRDGGACVLCESGHVKGDGVQARIEKIQTKVRTEVSRQNAVHRMSQIKETSARQRIIAEVAIKRYSEEAAKNQNLDPQQRNLAIEAAYQMLCESEAALSEVTQAKTQWQTIAEARRQARVMRKESEQATELVSACDRVLKGLTSRSRRAFVANVQQHLPKTDVFDLVLKQGKRNVCMFGFRRGDDLHTALSGAEWARLTIALGAACMTGGEGILAVLTPEERAFDPDTLASVMEALTSAPGQVILTSPIEPSKAIFGWTHIKV